MPQIFNKSGTITLGKYEPLVVSLAFVNDLTGEAIPTTGCSYRLAVKETINSAAILIEATGTTSLTLPKASLELLAEGDYVYELSMLTNQGLWVELSQAPFILRFGANI